MSFRAPPGWRAYAIGDVHGRADLLLRLVEAIRADHAARPPAQGLIVMLGDLIDRGPQSRAVIEWAMAPPPVGFERVVLGGNHEEVLLSLIDGNRSLLPGWLMHGGRQCLMSYGVDPDTVSPAQPDAALAIIRDAIPSSTVDFLRHLPDSLAFGDYLFVHAGIRPGIPLDAQSPRDLRWIRHDFLDSADDFGMMVVHGHTIQRRVDPRANRIGIDTGAWKSGRLTALALEDDRRWFLDTAPAIGGVASSIVNRIWPM